MLYEYARLKTSASVPERAELMTVLSVKNMTLRFGVTTVLDQINFALEENDRLGIIGVNGCGKSSLFKCITGEYDPEEGSISIAGGKSLAILSQTGAFEDDCQTGADDPGAELTAGETMLRAFPELLAMESRLEELQAALSDPNALHLGALSAEFTALNDRFLREGGLEFRGRCASMLASLGFDEQLQRTPVRVLSGGQRTRLSLAVKLSREPDILLLDEPTNHLDIETTAWLENFLINYRKCVLVISHDRYFLDKVTTKTLAIEHHRATLYNGGYTKSMEQRRADRITAEKHYREQQKEIARQEAYIAQQRQWNRERNIIAAESRQKLLDKMVKLEKPQNAPRPVRMKFTQSLASGNDVLSVQGLGMAFDERTLFRNVSFDVKKGQRVMLIGKNGCGKSTMIKLILDKLTPSAGKIEAGYNVQVGYYDQENQNLTDENTVLEELWSAYPQLPETKIRNTLAMFRFVGEDVFKTVAVLSGGERARLTLAKLILSHMNLLILDEPTNHLDIDSREALESALEEYDGTIFAVSHDRYFVGKLATRILELCPHPCFGSDLLDFSVGHPGQGYDEFAPYCAARIAERTVATEPVAATAPSGVGSAKEAYLQSKQNAADERKRKNRLEKLKKLCAEMEAELQDIDEQMAGDAATDYQLVAKLDSRKTELEDQLLAAYEEIEELENI